MTDRRNPGWTYLWYTGDREDAPVEGRAFIVLAGSFEGTAHFDLGVPADDTLASAGARDVFVARLAP